MFLNILKFTCNATRNYCGITSVQKTTSANSIFLTGMDKSNGTKKPRYDGRSKKRQWEDRRSDRSNNLEKSDSKQPKLENDTINEVTGAVDKIKRRKFVLLLGYSGVDYYGMQRNPGMKTIEEDLFKALLDVELINEECYNQVQNMQFQRAARTDKGVSAARQVVSLKLCENVDIPKINEHLPTVIKVFAHKRVTKGFNSKSQCDGRTYIYILPTVAFTNHNEEMVQNEFRLSEEKRDRINQVLKNFVGTKNFHNFTSKKKFNDPSASRFMKSFVCEEPFVREGVEFVVLKVYGQSFMLHQIRKMVGLTIAIVRGFAPEETMAQAFTKEKVFIPRAPGLGLVLDYVHYERYNFRYGEDGMHEKLLWDDVEDQVQEFKEKHIYPTIISTEIKEQSMINWLKRKLSKHSYDELDDEEDEDDDRNDSDEEDSAMCKKKKVHVDNAKLETKEPSSPSLTS